MLEKQLQDQKAFLEEGFKKKSDEMSGEILRLRRNIEDMEQNSDSVVDHIIRGFATVLSAPGILLAHAVRGIASFFRGL